LRVGRGCSTSTGIRRVYVNPYYFYVDDEEFGPGFVKVCSYAPWSMKVCLNGHEWAKRQLANAGVAFEALDNGFFSCGDPERLQAHCDRLGASDIEGLLARWLDRLPMPLSAEDRDAGYGVRLSIWQMEVSRTQVFQRPVRGREFFEQVIRDNIDLGRPEKVQLIFARKMRKATATDGRCRTRVITEGVIPSLHVYYKNTHLKQYHKTWKKGAALRTETTINNSYDFAVGRLIRNLPKLRDIGFAANRRVLEVETVSHDNRVGAQAFDTMQNPVTNDEGQRASALRFGDARVQALFAVLILLSLQIEGFHNRQMRPLLARMLGLEEGRITQGRMTYDLRRLRLHGLIERIEKTHRYRLTKKGLGVAFIYQRTYLRLLRPALSAINGGTVEGRSQETRMLQQIQTAIDNYISSQAA